MTPPPLGFAIPLNHVILVQSPSTLRVLPNVRPHGPCRRRTRLLLLKKKDDEDDDDYFLQRELARIESLDTTGVDDNNNDDDVWLDNLFDRLPDDADPEELEEMERTFFGMQFEPRSAETLEEALRQGVVPADAGVGSGSLPGDFGFDPLNVSDKDYIGLAQRFIINLIPGGETVPDEKRPSALILRDYREAEIRHGRLAMLAAMFWPLQEMLDRFLLDENQFSSLLGSLVNGGITLPYIPLFMTAVMLLLGYLDIYSKAIKEYEKVGEAFLPGDCFWDPLSILEGAPDSMKRNMQERELFNGRMAMLGVGMYIYEEAISGKPLIEIPGNELLFEPLYQVPFIQTWLDSQFGTGPSPLLTFPEAMEFADSMNE